MEHDLKILNIYGQEDNHTEARIVGNSDGLLLLKAAIERALSQGKSTTETDVKDGETALFASDGEGYEVVVERHNDEWGLKGGKDSFWNKQKNWPQYIIMERQENDNSSRIP